MADPKNPFFARAVANRYWAHFFGRGIVDPIDDMRVTNPPSNPELLDALAKTLVEHKYSLKTLVRTICKSRTYQLSALPNEFNKHDKQAFARYYPKRLPAEVLLDAVCQVTDSPTAFGGLPAGPLRPEPGDHAAGRVVRSRTSSTCSAGRSGSAPCECERVSEANLAQALHLLNSRRGPGEAQPRRRPGRRPGERQGHAPGRGEGRRNCSCGPSAAKPTSDDLSAALDHIEKHKANKKVAYENILWALINTKEFVFVQ